jgi:uncharacterized protein (DUF305 family)
MTRFSHRSTLALSLLALGLGACGGSAAPSQPAPAPAATAASGPVVPPPTPSSQRLIDKARADSARNPYTEADIHFMSAMIGHHSQAIIMARMAPTHGAGPSVRTLAERIINAQLDEIVTMQHWLADRNQPVPPAVAGPMKMQMNGMEHEMLMPGMLTAEQLQQLDRARGPEFDRLFLTYMIQHHKGATAMVSTLFGSYGAGQDEVVFKFASDVNVDQTTEIARMEKMLDAMPPAGGTQ